MVRSRGYHRGIVSAQRQWRNDKFHTEGVAYIPDCTTQVTVCRNSSRHDKSFHSRIFQRGWYFFCNSRAYCVRKSSGNLAFCLIRQVFGFSLLLFVVDMVYYGSFQTAERKIISLVVYGRRREGQSVFFCVVEFGVRFRRELIHSCSSGIRKSHHTTDLVKCFTARVVTGTAYLVKIDVVFYLV